MIPFRVIRSGVLLSGLLAALALLAPAASGGFIAALSAEQKTEAGLTNLTANELSALDQLVATDTALLRQLPSLSDPFSQRYTDSARKAAGLDRLTPEQLAALDRLIAAAIAAAPPPRLQPRERPRLRDDAVLSEKGRRLQVHGGGSFTLGWASGGRNFREAAGWVSFYDPATRIGVSFGYSRYKGDTFGSYYSGDYYNMDRPYFYSGPGGYFPTIDRAGLEQEELSGEDAFLRYPVMLSPAGQYFRR